MAGGTVHTPDARTKTEHDCDRIVYSDAFRRLGGVTQVAAAGERPLFHTRLTHTVKVAQLSRRLAEHLNRGGKGGSTDAKARREVLDSIGGVDASAAEAAGYGHDLGHPPFGHIGESELHDLCHKAGLDGFEGNAQTFRILTKLTSRGTEDPVGLGLDDRTLRAIVKYPWLRTGKHVEDSKWGAYATEAKLFKSVRKGITHEQPSVEAMIMDWADDISYAVHDLEDFFRAGHIPLAELFGSPSMRGDFIAKAVSDLHSKSTRDFNPGLVQQAMDNLDALLKPVRYYQGTADDQRAVQDLSRGLINLYIGAAQLRDQNAPLYVEPQVRHEVLLLKQLTWQFVIYNPALSTLQEGQVLVIRGLFEDLSAWLERAEADEKAGKRRMHRLPRRLMEWYELTATEEGASTYGQSEEEAAPKRRARAVADYIASLTEGQALDLFERLRGSAPHSIMESWFRF
jgi:dGTPase